MQRFCQKVDSQLNICFKNQWYFVKNDHPKYDIIAKCLDKQPLTDKDFEEALSQLGLFKVQKKHKLEIKDGNIFIAGMKAPKVFAEIINNSLDNDVSVDYLIKFFRNIIFDTDYQKDKDTRKKVKNLLNSNAYCPDKRSQVVFVDKVNEYKELPFFSYAQLPENMKQIFRTEPTLEQLCKDYFGDTGKNWQKFVLDELLNEENKTINDKILMYGVIFKDRIKSNNFKKLYNEDVLKDFFNNPHQRIAQPRLHILNQVFEHFTEKKIVNFFNKGYKAEYLEIILDKYPVVSRVHNIGANKFLTIKDLKEFVEREARKIEMGEDFPLCLEVHFPALEKIKNKYYEEFDMTCIIPQTYHELVQWSATMGNCIGQGTGYGKRASEGKTLLIGFSKNKNPEDYKPEDIYYNLEISNGVIRQFEAKQQRSRGVSPEHKKMIKELLQSIGVVKQDSKK